MPSNETKRFLCLSVHDVAAHTWHECERLLSAISEVGDIPVTLLVVPAYHHRPVADAKAFDRMLEKRLSMGDELALHGYTHLDEGAPPSGWWERYKRQVYTTGEGEFSALSAKEAKKRLAWGIEWFEQRSWPLHGFVAPAWLLSEGALQAVREFPFQYTTTYHRFHLLAEQRSLFSPSLVYSTRNSWGRALSRQGVAAWSALLHLSPLVRLGLHPRDACYPRTISHLQRTLEKLLATREAHTKASFAQQWCVSSQWNGQLDLSSSESR